MRFVEISYVPIVSLHRPDEVLFICTAFRGQSDAHWSAKFASAARLLRVAAWERPEMVFCKRPTRFLDYPQMSKAANWLRWLMWNFLRACFALLAWRGVVIAIIDFEDQLTLDRPDFRLLRHCRFYFKRELPQNHWAVFQRVAPLRKEQSELASDPAFRPHIGKFRPLSLGVSEARAATMREIVQAQNPTLEKTTDVFFAGHTHHSTVRSAGLAELDRLRARGVRVDVVNGMVAYNDFILRMSRAWLVWSPEGSGWDCYRHYEAVLAGAIPIMNYPGIRQHAPLVDGRHCFYYPPEPGGLENRALEALRDHANLRAIQKQGHAHVTNHHLHAQLGRYILAESGYPADEPSLNATL